jgi:hypothetical protein
MNFSDKINGDVSVQVLLFGNQLADRVMKGFGSHFSLIDAYMSYDEFGGSLINEGFEVFVIKPFDSNLLSCLIKLQISEHKTALL